MACCSAAYKEALKYNKYYMHANLNLGRMYRERKGDSRTAIKHLENALLSAGCSCACACVCVCVCARACVCVQVCSPGACLCLCFAQILQRRNFTPGIVLADEPEAQGHVLYALGLCSMDIQDFQLAERYFLAAAQVRFFSQLSSERAT